MTADNAASNDGFTPEQFIAQFERQILELEAAGARPPEFLKHQLERMKRMLAEGRGEGIQFMRAADGSDGFMGFAVPVDPTDPSEFPGDSERGAP